SSWNKDEWIASLNDEQRDLLKLEIDTIDDSWMPYLASELTKSYFLELKRFLAAEKAAKKTIFPPESDIYSWSKLTPLNKVRVVILGQDPYHNVGQAHGLAFSVRPPTPVPPSLRNMMKTISIDYPEIKFDLQKPDSGSLVKWAAQGVLMLNASLTVRAHEANSHAKRGWEQFTEAVLTVVGQHCDGVCFMAWGSPAGKRMDAIRPRFGSTKNHLILKAVHPSPLSASRGFFECGHFRKCNDYLTKTHGAEAAIDWRL
ncbi:hypothetical protein CANCADRAFT_17222, partial [Tortispora caseinolytica NRRL Y-17796]